MVKKIYSSIRKLSPISIIALVLVVCVVALAGHRYLGNNAPSNVSPKGKPQTNSLPHTVAASPSSVAQGGAVDTHGNSASSPANPQSEWITSTSGLITVQQPVKNSVFKSGDTVSGEAQVKTVQYRLVDDRIGVLAQGSLSVVNGKFSGTLGFKSSASTGKLDIFSYDPSFREVNEVQIPVTFGQ